MAADQHTQPPGPGRRERGGPPPESSEMRSGEMKEDARRAAQEMKGRARDTLEQGKERAAGKAEEVADAVGEAADRIGERNPTMAEHALRVSDGIARLADRLRSGNIDDLASEATALARRNPMLFVAGSVGLGMLLSRFMKASGSRQRTGELFGEGERTGRRMGRRTRRGDDVSDDIGTDDIGEEAIGTPPGRGSTVRGAPDTMSEPTSPRMSGSAAPMGPFSEVDDPQSRTRLGEPPGPGGPRPSREI